jgi:putative DNA primase/helicase
MRVGRVEEIDANGGVHVAYDAHPGVAPDTAEWPDPAPLGDDLPPVEAFALELLPQSLRPLVEDISDRMQTPPDFAAIAGIVALAGCVNRRALIRPKVEDNWTVTPNLWGAIIADPGFMKSPILRAMTAPLAHIEEMWRAEYESSSGDYEVEKEKAELRFQAWRERFKAAEKQGKTPPTQPDNTLKEPTLRRLLLTDATFEALHEILSKNPAGVLVTRDELTSLISTLDRPGREGERGFFLQSWNGDSGFTIDRIGRGSIYVPAVCVSLLGCIQPARLRWYLSQSLDGGPSDDGLLQRFQLAAWPDPPRDWKLIDRTPNNTALATAEKVFTILANLSADSPIQLHFDPEAQQLFFVWWAELERKIRSEAGLHPALVAHLAKYRSLLPTLAGLFELADAAAQSRNAESINLAHAQQAAAWCEYLESHAKRIYSCVTSPDAHAARLLAGHIEHGDLGQTFSTRQVYALHHWAGLDTPERVRAALDVLADAGWVREFDQRPEKGRPSEKWQVNPKVTQNAK